MIGWNLPIYAKAVVQDADTTIGFWVIEVITLILEDGSLGEDGKAVGKSLRDEELTMIVFRKLYSYMLAIGWRSLGISTATSSTLPFTQRTNLLWV